MDVLMDGCIDGGMDGWNAGWMDGWINVWMDGWKLPLLTNVFVTRCVPCVYSASGDKQDIKTSQTSASRSAVKCI